MTDRVKPTNRLDKLRVDLDTATREELVAEVLRLNATVDRWEKSWHQIVEANTAAWVEYVNARDAEIDRLRGLVNNVGQVLDVIAGEGNE